MSRIISPTTNTNPALVGEWYQQYTADTPAPAAPTGLIGAAPTSPPIIDAGGDAGLANQLRKERSALKASAAVAAAPVAAPAGPVQSYTPEQYKATDWNVDANQLVETGVNRIIDADGPMMDRARAAGDAQSNARGLVNSSMGVQASQNAVYDHALAIATPDAMTYRTAAQSNALERNQAAFNNANAVNRAREFGAAAANSYGIAELGASTQLQVAGIGAAASRYGTDVGARTELQRAQIAADSAKYNTDVGSATSLLQSQIAAGSSKTVAEINRDASWATANLNAETQRAVAEMNTGSAQLIATINADTNKYISAADNAVKLEVQKFANDNQLLVNTNQQAASAFNQAMASISTIQNNPAMDEAAKTAAIRSIFTTLNSQYATLSAVSGLNIPAILDFTGTDPVSGGAANTNTTVAGGAGGGGSGWAPGEGGGDGGPGPAGTSGGVGIGSL
jgi:hypothetical protein